MKKILIIEDEFHIADGIKLNLELCGYKCFTANTGNDGLKKLNTHKPDLVILDLMLPDKDGVEILKKIRSDDRFFPVLILSARGEVEDRKLGFIFGCDDYMSKPFDLEELELRVKRLLFRYEDSNEHGEFFEFGRNRIDFRKRIAITENQEISLTEQELNILKYLFSNSGKPVTREEILINALGYEVDVQSRTIDNFIVRFRKYFEKNPKKPKFFKSIRSVGYMFDLNE
ncbi:MAG: response regulator transcription factor [Desulfobacteraceae bacterium]|nr:response regulator transcription factor [Desulfobacteraceae bacterium]